MININNLEIPTKEVLRYLGHKNQEIEESLIKTINETRIEARTLIKPKYVLQYYNIKKGNKEILIEGTNLVLEGNSIYKHLEKSCSCALLVATLGNDIEKKTRLYERINLTKAIILDACATTAIEEICDRIEDEVRRDAKEKNLGITFRFSPGYGDLSLNIQKDFIDVLNANKTIGVTVSEHNLLFPRKSVTAIIGITEEERDKPKSKCENCSNFENCIYRREGNGCGA